MATYEVEVEARVTYITEVEADNESDAKDRGFLKWQDCDLNRDEGVEFWDQRVTNVEEVDKEPDVLQFSIDVTKMGSGMEEKIKEALADAGLDVLGVEWAATWTDEEYHKGQKPHSSI